MLCRYHFRTWRNMSRGWLNLHGHSHGRLMPLPRQTDVGVDAWDFRPVTLAEIKAEPGLAGMALVKYARLSVGPVREEEWRTILAMSRQKVPE